MFIFASIVNVNTTEMSFSNNSGQVGGAIYFDSSTLCLTDNTTVNFNNNSVTVANKINNRLRLKIAGGAVAMTLSILTIRHNVRVIFIDN